MSTSLLPSKVTSIHFSKVNPTQFVQIGPTCGPASSFLGIDQEFYVATCRFLYWVSVHLFCWTIAGAACLYLLFCKPSLLADILSIHFPVKLLSILSIVGMREMHYTLFQSWSLPLHLLIPKQFELCRICFCFSFDKVQGIHLFMWYTRSVIELSLLFLSSSLTYSMPIQLCRITRRKNFRPITNGHPAFLTLFACCMLNLILTSAQMI